MAKMKENAFQTKLSRMLRDRGALVLNVHGHGFQAPGWPDLYVAHNLWTGWIELKVGERKVTVAQGIKIREIRRRDVDAVILRLHEDGVVQEENGRSSITLKGLTKDNVLTFLQECCNATE